MARIRVTARRSGPAAPNPRGEHLGDGPREPPEFVEPPRETCPDATAAQLALQSRCAAAAPPASAEAQPLAGLGALNREPGVLLRLFASFSADERARLALVARSWAAYLARPEAWQVLDVSPAGGIPRALISDSLLRGAAARACGTLHTLDVSDCVWRLCIEARTDGGPLDDGEDGEVEGMQDDEALQKRRYVSLAAILSVLAANGAALRVLRALCARELCDAPAAAGLRPPQLLAALGAAPSLAALHADVACMPCQAPALLRGEGPYGPLRVRRLALCGQYRQCLHDDPAARPNGPCDPSGDDHTLCPALAAQLGAHAPLVELELDRVHLGPDAEGAARALAACRNVRALAVHGAEGPASTTGYARQAPALAPETTLAALLPPLRELRLQLPMPLHARDASRLAQQLRDAPLQALSLQWPGVDRTAWPGTHWIPYDAPDAAVALAAGLAGHPTLRRLWLRDWPLQPAPGGAVTAPALLGALLAHAPALEALCVSGGLVTHACEQNGADDAHAAALLAALAASGGGAPRLRHLSVPSEGLCGLTAAAVRAAAPALRTLTLLMGDDEGVKHHNSEYCRRGRGAVRRWVPRRDLLNDTPPQKPASDAEEEDA
jgi:hypothetical protein